MIRLRLKISEKFTCLILQDGFWVVHISFVRMVKFKSLEQFPVDHLGHPVVSSLILFLCLLCDWSFRIYHHITNIIIIIIIIIIRVFHISASWRSFTRVWVTQVSSGFQDSSQYSSRPQQCSFSLVIRFPTSLPKLWRPFQLIIIHIAVFFMFHNLF